ncbi:MAG: ATP-binding protein [Acidobacteriota bacterium]|nr:ATP-binding protein [Acidobacteriota bacterium]MDQ5835495.1 ATP-binding protein [Acidobacteriota bacterium]
MPIAYPTFFEALLQRDRSLRASVDGMVVAFDGWLTTSRLPFFTDYTDHGVEHLNRVLATADHLITDTARNVFTPSDVAVLIAATLLHDSAMHLSEAGFHMLIQGEASEWRSPAFSDRPWPTLWEEFLFSAKRWDERRLREVLGETPAGELRAQVRNPFEGYDDLSDTDRKLIGEFIRRHHPRMAHEFALFGIPGRTLVDLGGLFRADLRDISGLVARSHGLPVRVCLEYLREHYHRREYAGVHAVYLMTLLRVADYLQIQAERAPAVVFQYRHIPSKLSELEWKAHHAISNITQTHDDPESIEIQARPRDVHTYLRLKEWLSGIQEELDASWAVLGETYGSHPRLSGLGLILRRVRSNLDDVQAFSRRVSFVPERIELTVARPDLLKLLVGPLYDNIPSIGIRELIQNSVDAVREREVLQQNHPELRGAPLVEQEHDVEVWLDSPDERGYAWLTVSDRGAGMSVEVIRDYFLTAGASFRNSDAWKREFETEAEDRPRSRVMRSGRFGVGVLAGFLLGSCMDVATRHIRSESGTRFSTTLDLSAIELRRDPTLRVGTVIRIQVSPAVYQKLVASGDRVSVPEKFGWFIYDHPSVARFIGSEREKLEQKFAIATPDPKRPSALRRLRGSHGYSVYWTYKPLPSLSVNGIFITNTAPRRRFSRKRLQYSDTISYYEGGTTISIEHPKICVEDRDGAFPLNLRRSDITETEYSFESRLITDIVDDFLAYLLVNCPESFSDARWMRLDRHPGIHCTTRISTTGFYESSLCPFMSSARGLSLLCRPLQAAIKASAVYLLSPTAPPGIIDPSRHADSIFTTVRIPDRFDDKNRREETILTDVDFLWALSLASDLGSDSARDGKILVGDRKVVGLRLLLPSRIAEKTVDPARWVVEIMYAQLRAERHGWLFLSHEESVRKRLLELSSQLEIKPAVRGYSFVETRDCPATRLRSLNMKRCKREVYILEVCLSPDGHGGKRRGCGPPLDAGLLARRWQKVIGQPFIPFDPAVRKQELRHVYQTLGEFILSHEAMKHDSVLH